MLIHTYQFEPVQLGLALESFLYFTSRYRYHNNAE
jgi:hypothetical protein